MQCAYTNLDLNVRAVAINVHKLVIVQMGLKSRQHGRLWMVEAGNVGRGSELVYMCVASFATAYPRVISGHSTLLMADKI